MIPQPECGLAVEEMYEKVIAMSTNIWFISDTHFGHENCVSKFKREDDSPLRDFKNADHMDQIMIDNWNRLIKPTDKVYHLGDVTFSNQKLHDIMPRLNGKKRLILGNHDTLDMGVYRKFFQKIMSWRQFRDGNVALICTHFPLHDSSFIGRSDASCLNIHGHIHARNIPDDRYVNICVEQTNYCPVNYDVLISKARK